MCRTLSNEGKECFARAGRFDESKSRRQGPRVTVTRLFRPLQVFFYLYPCLASLAKGLLCDRKPYSFVDLAQELC